MRKFLIAFGLIWTFIWSAYGLFLGVMKHTEWLENMKAAAVGSDLSQFLQSWIRWATFCEKYTEADCELAAKIIREVADSNRK